MGPRAGPGAAEASDGSFFDVVAGGIHHRYSEETPGPLRAAFDMTSFELRADGQLSDLAPTLLELMELPQPKEMTGVSLLRSN